MMLQMLLTLMFIELFMGMNDIGMASAASFYQSIMGFILVLTSNLIVRRLDPEKALF